MAPVSSKIVKNISLEMPFKLRKISFHTKNRERQDLLQQMKEVQINRNRRKSKEYSQGFLPPHFRKNPKLQTKM
jgi:hypothetical protein